MVVGELGNRMLAYERVIRTCGSRRQACNGWTIRFVKCSNGEGAKPESLYCRPEPDLRGWAGYLRLTETRRALEESGAWLRRKLLRILWRRESAPKLAPETVCGRGAERVGVSLGLQSTGSWWTSGAGQMDRSRLLTLHVKTWTDFPVSANQAFQQIGYCWVMG